MTDDTRDHVGPVDFVIVEFPAEESNFSGEVLEEIGKLVDAGTIRLIDGIVLVKDATGGVEAVELSELGGLGALESIAGEFAEFLAAEDVANLAAAMDPETVAGVLVYENVWAAPFAAAARRAGGRLIADGRIHSQAIAEAIQAEQEFEEQGA